MLWCSILMRYINFIRRIIDMLSNLNEMQTQKFWLLIHEEKDLLFCELLIHTHAKHHLSQLIECVIKHSLNYLSMQYAKIIKKLFLKAKRYI